MAQAPSIEEIIEEFEHYGFDDDHSGQNYLRELLKKHREIPVPESGEIRKTIRDELITFYAKIQQHTDNEFFYVPETDYKYGHWNILMWIFSRWFVDATCLEDMPEWYRNIGAIVSENKPGRLCSNVVYKMIGAI